MRNPVGCFAGWEHDLGSRKLDLGSAQQPSEHTASFTVIDVYALTEAGVFDTKLRKLIDEIHAAPTAAGISRVLLPGEREWQNLRNSEQSGILLPADVHEKIEQVFGADRDPIALDSIPLKEVGT